MWQKHPLYDGWRNMHARCNDPRHVSYRYYGEKGITVCERWNSFKTFCEDMGERPAGYSIDRIDSRLPYSPENCRWANAKTQTWNRSITRFVTFRGETKPVSVWAQEYGLSNECLFYRLDKLKMPIDVALTLPRNKYATLRYLEEHAL